MKTFFLLLNIAGYSLPKAYFLTPHVCEWKIKSVLSLWHRQNKAAECLFFSLPGHHLLSFHAFSNVSNNRKQCFLFGPLLLFPFLFSNCVFFFLIIQVLPTCTHTFACPSSHYWCLSKVSSFKKKKMFYVPDDSKNFHFLKPSDQDLFSLSVYVTLLKPWATQQRIMLQHSYHWFKKKKKTQKLTSQTELRCQS